MIFFFKKEQNGKWILFQKLFELSFINFKESSHQMFTLLKQNNFKEKSFFHNHFITDLKIKMENNNISLSKKKKNQR